MVTLADGRDLLLVGFTCTTGVKQGASLKAACPGRGQDVEFSEAAGVRVSQKGTNSKG